MNRALRTFLLWVLTVAMPVQSMAASFMWVCAPTHERMTKALVAEVHAEPECHHGAMPADTASGAAAAPLVSGEEVSCSACAACCVWLALPTGVFLPAPSCAVHAMATALSLPSHSHQPAGLDRPPQRSTA
jgi:hypothetical protein